VNLVSTAFRLGIRDESGEIVSLIPAAAPSLEFIRPDSPLGEVILRYRIAQGPCREASSAASGDVRQVRPGSGGDVVEVEIAHQADSADARGVRGIALTERFALCGDQLAWTLHLRNRTDEPIEVGDLAVPLVMNNRYTHDAQETFQRRMFRHAFISGHASFVYWQPVSGAGPHLLMTCGEGTHLEYFTDRDMDYAYGGGVYRVFIHSAASGQDPRGSWRQKHTSVVLAPREQKGDAVQYAFALRWAKDAQNVRDLLCRHGGLDIRVAPGMVVPEDSSAMLALRTSSGIESVAAEHALQTHVEYLGTRGRDVHVYRVKFNRLGENLLTVRYGGGRHASLEFFVTQPLETLIRKRAAFIATRQQHRDSNAWYDGLFSLWDVRQAKGKNLLGPDNLGGQHPYAVSGSDDPSNSKCFYLSAKNVVYPDAQEIEALEYFIEHFVWGKHQRTDQEQPHPYGIYGCDSWHQCRNSKQGLGSGGHGQERMWRTFDYTTYFALYFNLYRIARRNPHLMRYLDAGGYLERAYGTARAYFEVPYSIRMEGWAFNGWCDWAYKIGNFHEKYLLDIIDALRREGQADKASYLQDQWEKKVRYFLHDDPNPWISEMPVDSTAFESTYAIARYAMGRELPAVERLWQDKNTGQWRSYPALGRAQAQDFLSRQLLANVACRGWLEASYYHLGSDFRACGSGTYNLSYMSQMGGWAIMDHAVRFAQEPWQLIALGYAGLLSSWALVNAGPAESRYGYWHSGELHDGAAAWGFMPQKLGREWNSAIGETARGPWPVDGEIDHGLGAAVEQMATIVAADPIFGLLAYGGEVAEEGGRLRVICRDGVRRRLHVVTQSLRLHLELECGQFAADRPVTILPDGSSITFDLESDEASACLATLHLEGLPKGTYAVRANADKPSAVASNGAAGLSMHLRLSEYPLTRITLERVKPN